MFRDRLLASYVGRRVIVPVGDDSVRGVLSATYRHWLVLSSCESADGSVDGDLVLSLPVAWVQVVS